MINLKNNTAEIPVVATRNRGHMFVDPGGSRLAVSKYLDKKNIDVDVIYPRKHIGEVQLGDYHEIEDYKTLLDPYEKIGVNYSMEMCYDVDCITCRNNKVIHNGAFRYSVTWDRPWFYGADYHDWYKQNKDTVVKDIMDWYVIGNVTNIKLAITEDKIYNEYELIDAITNPTRGPLEIVIDEGPDLSVIKLFGRSFVESLHMLADNLGIDKKTIKIITYNLVQDQSVWPNIEIRHWVKYFTDADRFEVAFKKDIKKHFGLFVGNSRWSRLYMASVVHGLYRDKTMMSFWQHHLNNKAPANLRIDDVLLRDTNELVREQIIKFIKHLPLHLNPDDIKLNLNTGADITRGDWETPYEILPYYNSIFMDIVCETWHEGQCFLPNEKTGRPIIARTPFIAYAGKGFLKNLRKIGFMTFDRWWSEEYDNHNGVQRIQQMLKEIKKISVYPIDRLQEIHQEMLPTLQHNYELIKTLTPAIMRSVIIKKNH
jgi:hypothetical protein